MEQGERGAKNSYDLLDPPPTHRPPTHRPRPAHPRSVLARADALSCPVPVYPSKPDATPRTPPCAIAHHPLYSPLPPVDTMIPPPPRHPVLPLSRDSPSWYATQRRVTASILSAASLSRPAGLTSTTGFGAPHIPQTLSAWPLRKVQAGHGHCTFDMVRRETQASLGDAEVVRQGWVEEWWAEAACRFDLG